MTDNAGNEQMVASAYIKVKIAAPGEGPEDPDKTRGEIELGTAQYKYSQLTDNMAIVKNVDGKNAVMTWQDINTLIYGTEGLTSQNFWSAENYGANNGTQYTVEVAVQQNGRDVVLNPTNKTATVGQVFKPNVPGLATEVLFGKGDTETAYVNFQINNLVKTNETYDNVDGKGAKYTVTITLPSNNLKNHPNIVIKEVIYVLNDYQPYKANPNFEVTPGNPGADITVQTKGIRNEKTETWEMKMNVKEAFLRVSNQDITEYFATNNNVASTPAIAFSLKPNQPEFGYDPYDVFLAQAMDEPTKTAHMQYTVTLKNGEVINRPFDVNFINPFVQGQAKGITLLGNKIGGDSQSAVPNVIVKDTKGEDIYMWDATADALALTDIATGDYFLKAENVSVTYALDKTSGNYAEFVGQLVTGSKFDVEEDGTVVFKNLGAELQKTCNVNLIATVTFKDLSVVKVTIPVTVTTASK